MLHDAMRVVVHTTVCNQLLVVVQVLFDVVGKVWPGLRRWMVAAHTEWVLRH